MSPRVAVIGSMADELPEAPLRCATPSKAIEARAALWVMDEADWLQHRDQAPANAVCALVTPSARREVCGEYLQDTRVRHLLFRGPQLAAQLEETLALASGESPMSPAALGLGDWSFAAKLKSSDEERPLLKHATRFAHDAGARGRAAENWLDALSEAVSNAVYNAPRKGSAAPYLGLHRKQAVALEEAERVEVTLFASQHGLAWAVTDAYGSLTPRHFQVYLGGALARGTTPALDKPGGAGLGLMMMFDRLERLVAMVEPGRRTILVGVGPLSYGRTRERGRTVQFFEAAAAPEPEERR